MVVIGAGSFGGWTALYLLRKGYRVTLVDAWGPGNARASSGGETRILRATYGTLAPYVRLAARAFQLWEEHETRWKRRLFVRTGSLRLKTRNDDTYERVSMPLLKEQGLTLEELSLDAARTRFPQFSFENVRRVFWEAGAGYLFAREACRTVLEGFLAEGGEYRVARATVGEIAGGELHGVKLGDGTQLVADRYLFACGPWLRELIPEVVGDLIRPTRQEVFFFGTPPGDTRFLDPQMPAWVDSRETCIWYGTPGNGGRGFKVADDSRGVLFDPTNGDRTPSPEALALAREELAYRFPALKDAPLVDARVCQYEETPDGNFIFDRHPLARNLWILGGGSGHGFKHGPALGELASAIIAGEKPVDPFFSVRRF